MNKRVVNRIGRSSTEWVGIPAFRHAIRRAFPVSGFQGTGRPEVFLLHRRHAGGFEETRLKYLSPAIAELQQFGHPLRLHGGIDAWKDAGLSIDENSPTDYDSGTVFGTGTSGVDKYRNQFIK